MDSEHMMMAPPANDRELIDFIRRRLPGIDNALTDACRSGASPACFWKAASLFCQMQHFIERYLLQHPESVLPS